MSSVGPTRSVADLLHANRSSHFFNTASQLRRPLGNRPTPQRARAVVIPVAAAASRPHHPSPASRSCVPPRRRDSPSARGPVECVRDSAAGDSRAADLIGQRARCRPLSYETFDGDRADVTTLETMMRMVERKMQQDSLHPDVALYVVRPIWTIRPLSDFADDAKIIFRYRPKFSSWSALSNLERNGVVL